MPRRLLVALPLSLVAALGMLGCSQETPTHPIVKHVPDKIKNAPKEQPPPIDEKNPPKYKVK